MDVLKDKQYKDYNYLSRYESFPYYFHSIDRKYIYGTTAQLDQNLSYSIYKVKRGDSWDSIALEMYNNPTFFWVLCDFNKVQDPYSIPEEGSQIKVPVLSEISFMED